MSLNILVFKRIKLILNKINLICDSVGLTENCSFNPIESTNYINNSQSIKESLEILDFKIKELESKINNL
jgi:hypothetical protein